MPWRIQPLKSVGPVKLGVDFEELRDTLGGNYELFRRTAGCREVVAAFDSLGLHVNVDDRKKITCVTVFPPNDVTLCDVHLLDRPIAKVVGQLAGKEFAFNPVDSGYWNECSRILLIDVDGVVDGVEIHSRV